MNFSGEAKEREDWSKLGDKRLGCEDGRWFHQAYNRVPWWALVLAVLYLRVLLTDIYLVG
jgi:hypothetical protein